MSRLIEMSLFIDPKVSVFYRALPHSLTSKPYLTFTEMISPSVHLFLLFTIYVHLCFISFFYYFIFMTAELVGECCCHGRSFSRSLMYCTSTVWLILLRHNIYVFSGMVAATCFSTLYPKENWTPAKNQVPTHPVSLLRHRSRHR